MRRVSDLSLLLISFRFFLFFFSNPIKSDKPVGEGGRCCCQGDSLTLASFYPFICSTGSFSLHLSPQTLLLFSGLSPRWRLISSCLQCLGVADKSSSIKAPGSPAAFKGGEQRVAEPGRLSGEQSCAHARGPTWGSGSDQLKLQKESFSSSLKHFISWTPSIYRYILIPN